MAFYDKGADTEVLIETSGGTDTADQPAFINTGTCSPAGQLTGAPLEVLNVVHEGRSDTVVQNRKLSDLQGGRYHIDVQSSANPTLVNSCADIP